MPAARHSGANVGLRKEVTSRHPCRIPLSPELAPPLETLIRELVAHARGRSGATHVNNSDAQILIDAQVDGIRCLVTQLEKHKPPQDLISFSPRESEIARMVANGYPNKTIAAVLEISSWTVCTHLRRMFAKLRVSSRAAMVARMMDIGLLGRGSK